MRDGRDIITIDGVGYDFEEMDSAAQYAVKQIRDLNRKYAEAQFHISQLAAARQFFTDTLLTYLKEMKDPDQLELPLNETQHKKV